MRFFAIEHSPVRVQARLALLHPVQSPQKFLLLDALKV